MPDIFTTNFGMGMNNNFMPNMMMNNNSISDEIEDWLKGFQFGVQEVNNINDEDSNHGPKIHIIFVTTICTSYIMYFNYGTTIDQILEKYLQRKGRHDLYSEKSNKICFLFNACRLRFGDKTPVEEFFKGIPNPKVVVSGVNDLPTVMPELMQDWNYENNTGIDPTRVGRGSHEYVSWKCHKCNYVWKAQVYNRANGKGCPCCANRIVVPGINDLATTDPELSAEWHPTLNDLNPTEVTRGQAKKVYWLCPNCGNVWQDSLNHRSGGRGCSVCNRHKRKNR